MRSGRHTKADYHTNRRYRKLKVTDIQKHTETTHKSRLKQTYTQVTEQKKGGI